MKVLKSSRGSALIMVLIIFTVFTILGTTLFASNINQNIQINRSNNNLQAVNLAEMGIAHFQEIVNSYVEDHQESLTIYSLYDWVEDYIDGIGHELIMDIPEEGSDYSYIVNNFQLSLINNMLEISFNSTGIAYSEFKTMSGKMIFQSGSGTGSGTDPGDSDIDESEWGVGDDEEYDNEESGNVNGDYVSNGDTLFTRNVSTNYDTSIEIYGNATFEKNVNANGSSSYIYIQDDGIFMDSLKLNNYETYLEVGGNSLFEDQTHINGSSSYIEVGQDALFKSAVNLNNYQTHIHIGGSAGFEGDVRVNNSSSYIEVENNASFDGQVRLNNYQTSIHVGGGASFDDEVRMNGSSSQINVEKDSLFNQKVILNGYKTVINVQCSAIFKEEVQISNASSQINIEDDGTFFGPISVTGWGSEININQNGVFKDEIVLQGSSINVQGDALFLFSPDVNNSSQITINGDLYYDGSPPSGINFSGTQYPVSEYEGPLDGSFSCTQSGGFDNSSEINY
ncbi:MAG: pilus assembly PilX N-terminal domain-containing protein [Bacillaceae bacterium]|nr:pilus assembly PilX N-terminal domain-containing protein [Bacillaceae bacterium]